jgi:hypothetical protein
MILQIAITHQTGTFKKREVTYQINIPHPTSYIVHIDDSSPTLQQANPLSLPLYKQFKE